MALKSCNDCPFRRDGLKGLRSERIREIVVSISNDEYFTCHKTRKTVCIGSLNFIHQVYGERAFALQHVRTAERLGLWDPDREEPNTFYSSVPEMIEGHKF